MTLPVNRWIVALTLVAVLAVLGGGRLAAQVSDDPFPSDSSATPSGEAKEPEVKYPEVKEALELFVKRDLDGALAKLKEAKTKYKDELRYTYAEHYLAIRMLQLRDTNGALDMLGRAAEAYPELPPANVQMAIIFFQARAWTAAQSWLERAVIETANDPEAYILMGTMAVQGNQITPAELLLTKADTLLASFAGDADRKKKLQQRTHDLLARVARARARTFQAQARAHRNAGRADDAKQASGKAKQWWTNVQGHLESWLKLDSENVSATYRLGVVMFQLGEAGKARELFIKAHGADPPPVAFSAAALNPFATMALQYEQHGAHQQAVENMKYALYPKQGGNDLFTRLTAGQWAIGTGDIAFAKQQADAAMAIDSKHLSAKMQAGVVALWLKDYTTAESYFQDVMLLQPKQFQPKNNLALALCEQDDLSKKSRAVDYAKKNAEDFQRDATFASYAASTYGWVLFKAGRKRDAEKVLTQLIKSRQGQNINSDTWYYYARVLFELARKEQAKQVLESILKRKAPFSLRQDAEDLLRKCGP